MVERILDAATRVLVRDGYYDTSTNRIAREAGISPGSIYQYFADKDEIIDAISIRLIGDMAAEMEPVLRETAAAAPEVAVRQLLTAAFAALQSRSEVLRALVDFVPADQQQRHLDSLRSRLTDRVHTVLTIRADDPDPQEIERRTWMIVEISQGLLVRYVLDEPGFSDSDFLKGLSGVVHGLAV